MQGEVLIDMMLGKENFQTCSAAVHAFGMPCMALGALKNEAALGAIRDPAKVRLMKTQRVSCYKTPGYSEELGFWNLQTWRVQEGAILKIHAKLDKGYLKEKISASKLIQVRESAPFNEIRIPLTGHLKAMYKHAYVIGRFDLLDYAALTKDEQAAFGISRMPIPYQRAFDNFHVNRMMQFIEKEAALSAKPLVKQIVAEETGKEFTQLVKPRTLKFD